MVIGLNRLKRRLTKTVPAKIELAAREGLAEAATIIVAEMKRLVPVGDGTLRDSIGWTFGSAPKGTIAIGSASDANGRIRVTIYAGGGDAFHAWFQEFGTVIMAANPFFFPAYRSKKRGAKSRVTRRIKKAIRSS